MTLRSGTRKALILETLAAMLAQPHAARITTAALADRLGVSEAALYRHFSGKAAIYMALLDSIEAQLFEDLGHIAATQADGTRRLGRQVHALLLFAERHPGHTRMLTGDALVTEDWQLQVRLGALIAAIQAELAASARLAHPALALAADPQLAGGLLMHWISGRWLRYAQTSWQALPTARHAEELALMGLRML